MVFLCVIWSFNTLFMGLSWGQDGDALFNVPGVVFACSSPLQTPVIMAVSLIFPVNSLKPSICSDISLSERPTFNQIFWLCYRSLRYNSLELVQVLLPVLLPHRESGWHQGGGLWTSEVSMMQRLVEKDKFGPERVEEGGSFCISQGENIRETEFIKSSPRLTNITWNLLLFLSNLGIIYKLFILEQSWWLKLIMHMTIMFDI